MVQLKKSKIHCKRSQLQYSLYQTILKQMLITPLKRFLTLTRLNPVLFSSTPKPTKLFQSLISCPEQSLQKYLREMSKLDDDNMKACIDILIARMQASELEQHLLYNELYLTYIRRFPLYQFHANLQMVGVKLKEMNQHRELGEQKEEKMKIVEINNIYAKAFDSLRKLKKQQVEKEQPYLLHSFALYHSNVLAQLVKDEQVETTLKKAVDIMKKLMSKCIIILDNKEKEYGKDFQYSKEQILNFKALEKSLRNKVTIPTVQRSVIEDHFNTLYYVRKTYTSIYCKAATALFDITNRLTNPKCNARKEPPNTVIHPGLFGMIPSFQLALELYRRMGDDRGAQLHYFPIRRQLIQLLYEQSLTKIHLYQIPQMKKQYLMLLQDLKQQIIYALSQFNYEDQEAMTFFSTYQVLFMVHIVIKQQEMKEENPDFDQRSFRELLEITFHQLLLTITDNNIKDMLGIHLLEFIETQYNIDFLGEFEQARQKRQLNLPPKKSQAKQYLPQQEPNYQSQQIQPQLKKTRRRKPIKPSDLQ